MVPGTDPALETCLRCQAEQTELRWGGDCWGLGEAAGTKWAAGFWDGLLQLLATWHVYACVHARRAFGRETMSPLSPGSPREMGRGGAVVKGWYERVSEELAAGLGASWQEHARTSEGPRGREA